jgi:hypothetical protein
VTRIETNQSMKQTIIKHLKKTLKKKFNFGNQMIMTTTKSNLNHKWRDELTLFGAVSLQHTIITKINIFNNKHKKTKTLI